MEGLPLPLVKSKRRGIFCLTKPEKEELQLKRKEKDLLRKKQRKNMLTEIIMEENEKEQILQKEVETLKTRMNQEKEKLIVEGKE